MPVSSIPQAINLNADTPSAPTGFSNIIFQTDGGTPYSNISAFDPLFIGDSGSGGYSGNVPAPGSGDAAAGKFLKADGTWAVPSASASGSTSSGYWVKNGSFIHQWGSVTTDINGGTLAVTFPTAYTNSSSISVVVCTRSSTDRITFVVDGSVTTTGFTIGNNGSSGYAYWIADGF